MSGTMAAMARARTGRDDRGRLCVFASVRAPGGQRLRKRIVVPGDDESLAAETVRELNRRFALGDLSWFLEPTPRAPRRTAPRAPMVARWCERWLEESRGEIGDHTWRTYRSEANDLARRFGDRRLDQITVSDLIALRRDLKRLGRSERTVRNRLAFLRLLIRDARLAGLVESSPFDVPLPRRRTKHDRQQRQTKRVTFRPLLAAELERVLEVLRSPRDATERMWFPLTDLLLLTGLRWGEGAGLLWPDVSERGALVHVQRTLARGGRVEPTKTGASWTIPIRAPLADLLQRQRALSYVGRTESWVFPSQAGGPLDYHNWRHRGWKRVLERSKVSPREGDAQKALRRSYITSALVGGRNPKLVAAELGHATSHMVVNNYDSFLDPRTWPDAEEIERLRAIYGWSAVEDRSVVAPLGHPLGARDGAREDVCPEVTETPRNTGTPGGIRTPDPQVRSLVLYPAELPARPGVTITDPLGAARRSSSPGVAWWGALRSSGACVSRRSLRSPGVARCLGGLPRGRRAG